MGDHSTSEWLGFFTGAGIPKSVSARYAVTFVENRISMEMLMDLNKDYLKDLGVTALGDIISILKHAKQVQGKMTSDRALKSSNSATSSTSTSSGSNSRQNTPPRSNSKTRVKPSPEVDNNASNVQGPKVTARLGPPPPRNFSELNSKKVKNDVFSRLNQDEALDDEGHESSRHVFINNRGMEQNASAFQRLDRETRTISNVRSPQRERIQAPQSEGSFHATSPESSGVKRKKYIMVRTLADGTKIRQEVDPSDPLLQKVKITKRTIKRTVSGVTLGSEQASSSGQSPRRLSMQESSSSAQRVSLRRPITAPSTSQGLSSNSRLSPAREPRKRKMITGPNSASTSSLELRTNSAPSPNKSSYVPRGFTIKDRLSTGSKIARPRITGPGEERGYEPRPKFPRSISEGQGQMQRSSSVRARITPPGTGTGRPGSSRKPITAPEPERERESSYGYQRPMASRLGERRHRDYY